MPNVALAGGASVGLGRAMTIAILEMYPGQEWKPIILSRGSKAPLWLRAIDPYGDRVELRAVDYTDKDDIVKKLADVHTLVSVVLAKDGSQLTVQKNLLYAAVEAGCKRFAPSYWGSGLQAYDNVTLLRLGTEGLWEECEKHAEQLETALFTVGMFLNYLGIGAGKETDSLDKQHKLQLLKEGNGYMAGDDRNCEGVDKEGDMADGTGSFMLSIASGTAEIPMRDDGEFPRITFTKIRDVGKYLAAALNLAKWNKNMSIEGQTMRLDQVLALAKSISGKAIIVKKLTRAELEGEITTLKFPDDMLKQLWLELKICTTKDEVGEGIMKPVVNNLLPQIKPEGIAEYLESCWGKK